MQDNEAYRNNFRKGIKDWQTTIINKRPQGQEWLVILVVRPESIRASTGGSRLFSTMRQTLLDKIKADINIGKKDRCVELTWPLPQGSTSSSGWTEVVTRMKEGVIATFDQLFISRDEEIRKSEEQRTMPGWNFCTYFLLKVCFECYFVLISLVIRRVLQPPWMA